MEMGHGHWQHRGAASLADVPAYRARAGGRRTSGRGNTFSWRRAWARGDAARQAACAGGRCGRRARVAIDARTGTDHAGSAAAARAATPPSAAARPAAATDRADAPSTAAGSSTAAAAAAAAAEPRAFPTARR